MKYALLVNKIAKKYNYGEAQPYLTFRDTLTKLLSLPFRQESNKLGKATDSDFWALKDVTFSVEPGKILGIIGPNGAGKSTLLKIMSRITPPTLGEIRLKGSVASLLEVGTGFHQELTGRENIYLNGAILGMTRKEISSKFTEIVDFAGVEKFLDTPVKRYSSGMYVRLAFSVAAHLTTDILLVDEVLSVGDLDFQEKCLNKMTELVGVEGRTIIYVSHNLGSINELCDSVVLLSEGRMVSYGKPADVIAKYQKLRKTKRFSQRVFKGNLTDVIRIDRITVNNTSGNDQQILPSESVEIKVTGKVLRVIDNFRFTFSLYTDDIRLFSMHDVLGYTTRLKKGNFTTKLIIPPMLLRPGKYSLAFGGHDLGMKNNLWGEGILDFNILEKWFVRNEKINLGIINPVGCKCSRED